MNFKSFIKGLGFYVGIVVFIVCSSFELQAQVKGVFYGVEFDDSLAEVKTKLSEHCRSTEIISNKKPSFPIAKNSEQHFICEEINIGNNAIKEVVFVFGDDKLSFIEARGGAIKALEGKATDKANTFMNFKAFVTDLMFMDTEEDAVWLLTKESVHPNLFTWSNPYLPLNKNEKREYDQSAKTPNILEFGATVKDLTPKFKKNCQILHTRNIDKPSLPTNPKSQTQMECFGFEYAGFPRKIEAVFGDDALEIAWILTGKQEEDRVRKALTKTFGKAIFISETWEVFNDWQVALRKDKPEVLVMSKNYSSIFKERYAK